MILVTTLVLIVFSFLLIKAADITISALGNLGNKTHAGTFFLSAILLAIGTSLPELFVAITSALQDSPNLSLGNVMGANIANVSIIAGLAALIFGHVRVQGQIIRRDLAVTMVAGMVPFILIIDTVLSRVDGLILLSIYGVYGSSLFRTRYLEIAKEHRERKEMLSVQKILREITVLGENSYKELGKLFLGIALLLFSADMIVRIARGLAISLNLPLFLIGLVIVSIGTTLPELAFSIRSLKDRHPTMFYGNLLGSIIANSTLIIGIAAIITPLKIMSIDRYLIAFAAFVLIFSLFSFFTRSKARLDRWEAALLFITFIIFVIIEFIKF